MLESTTINPAETVELNRIWFDTFVGELQQTVLQLNMQVFSLKGDIQVKTAEIQSRDFTIDQLSKRIAELENTASEKDQSTE